MKTSELKELIKTMVRESVHEILAEKFIEKSINEMAGKKNEPQLQERMHKKPNKQPSKVSHHDVAEKYGIDENSMMADIYKDTLENNAVINGKVDAQDPPGSVSERVLEKSGIMAKDWTRYF